MCIRDRPEPEPEPEPQPAPQPEPEPEPQPEIDEIIIDVVKGWNMIGTSSDSYLIDDEEIVIPNTIYWFDGTRYGNFIDPNNLISNRGYWIKCNSIGTIKLTLKNNFSNEIFINLVKGWNMIGLSKNGYLSDPDNIVIPNTLSLIHI